MTKSHCSVLIYKAAASVLAFVHHWNEYHMRTLPQANSPQAAGSQFAVTRDLTWTGHTATMFTV